MTPSKSPITLEEAASTAQGFSSDSRLVGEGDIFVALKGHQADGHNFVKATLEKGALYVVVEKEWLQQNSDLQDLYPAKILAVESSSQSHRELAKLFRKKFQGKVIGVGGSSGKTTTKEFLSSLASTRYKVVKTERSQNGELGIPKTLEKLRPEVEVAIIEIGIDAPGDMQRHLDIVDPDFAVLTSIGEEHLNLLKDLETVFFEESRLFEHVLKKGGLCFAPSNDKFLARYQSHSQLRYSPIEPDIHVDLTSPLAKQNAALAIEVARHALGLTDLELKKATSNLELPEGRGRELDLGNGNILLADHYNSNPSSLRAALSHADRRAKELQKKLVLILGDMLDLGNESQSAHENLAQQIDVLSPDLLVLIGPEMEKISSKIQNAKKRQSFQNSDLAAKELEADKVENSIILLKGSRGIKLEKLLDIFN